MMPLAVIDAPEGARVSGVAGPRGEPWVDDVPLGVEEPPPGHF